MMLEINAKVEKVNRIIEKLIKLDEIRRKKAERATQEGNKR